VFEVLKSESVGWCQHVVCDEWALVHPGLSLTLRQPSVPYFPFITKAQCLVQCMRLIRLVDISYAIPVFETWKKIPVPRASEDCY
jgi:hypothetical protein